MNCDDFLPGLENGGAQAEAARRHAEECQSCRAAAQMLDGVKAELAGDERMPAAMRAAMLAVADGDMRTNLSNVERQSAALPPVHAPGRRTLWLAAIAATIVGAALGIWWQQRRGDEIARPRDPRPAPRVQAAEVRRVGPITVATIDPGRELAALADELAALTQSLADAKAGAERLAVEQALDRVLTDYQGTVAVRK